jgi:hypothetical protein
MLISRGDIVQGMKSILVQMGNFHMFRLFYRLERTGKEIRGTVFGEPVFEVNVDN